MSNRVDHPEYYKKKNGIETIEVIRHYVCDIANAQKYLMRAGDKPERGMTAEEKEVEDLRKALWYIQDIRENSLSILLRATVVTEPTMLLKIFDTTGHMAEDIAKGFNEHISEAIRRLLMVGLISGGKIYRCQAPSRFLSGATDEIQQRILEIESQGLKKDLDDIKDMMNGYQANGIHTVKPACRRETEPEDYDPLNMIIQNGTAYGLTSKVRKLDNGWMFSPCESCALATDCRDTKLCLLHQAEDNEYYKEIGEVVYSPAYGSIEVVDQEKELEVRRKKEEVRG